MTCEEVCYVMRSIRFPGRSLASRGTLLEMQIPGSSPDLVNCDLSMGSRGPAR